MKSLRWRNYIEKLENDLYKIDFVGLTKKELADKGILESNIYDCGIDTARESRFFSHVRQSKLPFSKQGRFATIVGLKGIQ